MGQGAVGCERLSRFRPDMEGAAMGHTPSGIAYPEDMQRLREMFDRFCRENGLVNGSAEAEDLAKAVMSLFAVGVDEETALLDSLAEYSRRKTRAELTPRPNTSSPAGNRLQRREDWNNPV
jgi:hypothetical protein